MNNKYRYYGQHQLSSEYDVSCVLVANQIKVMATKSESVRAIYWEQG